MVNIIFIFLIFIIYLLLSFLGDFISVLFLYGAVFYLFFLQWYANKSARKVKMFIESLIGVFGISQDSIAERVFFRRRFAWKTSAFQVVIFGENEYYEYWFIGGGFFLGCLKKTICIYRVNKSSDRKLEFVEERKLN